MALACLLAAHFAVCALWGLRVPIFQIPDEPAHYYYVLFLANRQRLPVFRADFQEVLWQGHGPPLYYALAAAALAPTGWLARSVQELAHLRWAMEVSGKVSPFEWEPTPRDERALRALRLLSALLSTGTVLVVFLLAGVAFPAPSTLPVWAAGTAAFWPQYTFMGGGVNNDHLANLLAGWWLLLMAQGVKRGEMGAGRALAAGALCGAAVLAKLLAFFLVPTLGVALGLAGVGWRRAARAVAAFAVGGLAVSGWWFLRNWLMMGEPMPVATGAAVFSVYATKGGLFAPQNVDFWLHRFPESFFTSLWGRFGWMNRPLPTWAYVAFGGVSAGSALGLAAWLGSPRLRSSLRAEQRRCLWLLTASICLLFGEVVGFNLHYYQPQGRYMFEALGAMATLLCFGWAGLVGLARRGRAAPEASSWRAAVAGCALMAGANLAILFSGVPL